MQKLLKPKALKPGSKIGIASPSRHAARDVIERGKALLEQAGFSVFVHPQNYAQDFQLAGTDKQRAEAFMD
ncbi:MAG TPA: LD-carboxypeptidase, partial [Alphaproteobacteria bacterium]|nr:LD-carboxypeptidase [Alphaproteobacteria bacterium]